MTSTEIKGAVRFLANPAGSPLDKPWDSASLQPAVSALLSGAPVIVPTETVYGLAADATAEKAVQAIYAAKGRPSNNPLICHVADMAMAREIADFQADLEALAKKFWPGPLTIVAPLKQDARIAKSATAGLDTVAVRCPKKAVMRQLIGLVGKPLAAPSANRSGKLSPVTASAAATSLQGRVTLAIDDGPSEKGLESTIVTFKKGALHILRPGVITREDLQAKTNLPIVETDSADEKLTAPGQLQSHYAPQKPVRLNIEEKQQGHVLIGFGSVKGDISLSPAGDLMEAARNLYTVMGDADALEGVCIDVAPIPMEGLGVAINDRLKRSAAPRPEEAQGTAIAGKTS